MFVPEHSRFTFNTHRRAPLDRTAGGGCPYVAIAGWPGEGTRPYVVRGDSCAVLLDLAEDPRIRGCRAADHDRITSGLGYHSAGVFRRADIAVPDHRNLNRILDGGNPIPACLAAVSLLTGAGMQRDSAQATVLGHLGQLDADDLVVIPPRAEFYCERDFHRCADSLENFADRGQITQKP